MFENLLPRIISNLVLDLVWDVPEDIEWINRFFNTNPNIKKLNQIN